MMFRYDPLKPFKESPPTSNVPTRDTSATAQSQTQNQKTTQNPSPFDHDQCNWPYGSVPPLTSLTSTSAIATPSTPTALSPAPSVGPSSIPMTLGTPTALHYPVEPAPLPIIFNYPTQFPYQNLSPDLTHCSSSTNFTKSPSTTRLHNSPASCTHIINECLHRHKNVMSQAACSLQFTEPRSTTLRESTQSGTPMESPFAVGCHTLQLTQH